MEGKTVISSLLIISLVLAQIQVEAKICCPTKDDRSVYFVCMLSVSSQFYCLLKSKCKNTSQTICPPGYTNDILENSGDAVNEYCKLGCASSVCGALTTLQNFDASKVLSEAVEQCTKACSSVCTGGSTAAVKSA
nr:thionin Thi2.2 [Arabidopsis thaliana]